MRETRVVAASVMIGLICLTAGWVSSQPEPVTSLPVLRAEPQWTAAPPI